MTSKQDGGSEPEDYMEELNGKLENLNKVDKSTLDEHQLRDHEVSILELREYKDHLEDYMKNHHPYDESMEVLDTDYDNYMFLYSCREDEASMNSDGKTYE